jgi:hypothetical protein
MTGFVIRLIILCAVIFGVAFGIAWAIKNRHVKRKDNEREEARTRIAALKRSLEEQEISVEEYDQLSRQIYKDCQDKGIEIDDL